MTKTRPLRRILGLGFGLAFAFGTMLGVGILRLPGTVAAAVGSPLLIIVCWCIGGLYSLMGAVSVSELAAMYPEAGGLRVYARRAFGELAGFVVGWADWLASGATLAYAAIAAVEFLGTLWPPVMQLERSAAIALLVIFGAMHLAGVRLGSSITTVASAAIGAFMLALVIGCFLVEPTSAAPIAGAGALPRAGMLSSGALLAMVPAIRALLTSYDGWYAPIYTAEECVDPSRTLPRAIIGGALAATALYVTINIALLRVLPIPVLAASHLPLADAAQIVLPRGSATLITALSLLIVLNLINGNVIMGTRTLFSIAREGLISQRLASVTRGGTPQGAMAATLVAACAMIMTGSFNEVISLFAVLILLYYCSTFLAVFVLRRRQPDTPRPYRVFGYPVSTAVVLAGSVAFLVAAVLEDWHSAVTAVIFLSLCVPAYTLAARSRRVTYPELASGPA